MPPIIAFAANRRGAGKSTAAGVAQQVLEVIPPKPAVARIQFAGPIRVVMAVFLEEAGYSPGDAHRLLTVDKEAPLLRVAGHPTARDLLVTFGTEWGRKMIHPEIWLNFTRKEVDFHQRQRNAVVIDDLRFADELTFLRSVGAHIIFIHRGEDSFAAIEGMINRNDCDSVVDNNGELGDLVTAVGGIVSRLATAQHLEPIANDD